MLTELSQGIIRFMLLTRNPQGELEAKVVGTGFRVHNDRIVTCSHVVADSLGLNHGPGFPPLTEKPEGKVAISFRGVKTDFHNHFFSATVTDWTDPEGMDLAVLQLVKETNEKKAAILVQLWEQVAVLPLGTSASVQFGEKLQGFGYSTSMSETGIPAEETFLGRTLVSKYDALTLQSKQATQGFSGGPIRCSKGYVRGIFDATLEPDKNGRQNETGFARPAELLWTISKDLRLGPRSDPNTNSVGGKAEQVLSPYRALDVFDEAHAWLYFGRDVESREVSAKLATNPLLAIVGVSGSGKSSLARAGLRKALSHKLSADNEPGSHEQALQRLAQRGRCTFVCSKTPLFDLIKSLASPTFNHKDQFSLLNLTPEFQENCFNAHPEVIAKRFGLDSTVPLDKTTDAERMELLLGDMPDAEFVGALKSLTCDGNLILLVDQLEKLYSSSASNNITDQTQSQNPSLIESNFASKIVACASDGIKILLTLRTDFYDHALRDKKLGALIAQPNYHITLSGMTESHLVEAISEPARMWGVHVEPDLIEKLVLDLDKQVGNLPLLEFALSLLWERELAANGYVSGVLSKDSYQRHLIHINTRYQGDVEIQEKITGLHAAIASEADGVWDRLVNEKEGQGSQNLKEMERLFIQLISLANAYFDAQFKPHRVISAPLDFSKGTALSRRIVEEFVERRLLTIGHDHTAQGFKRETVELAHEKLISAWPKYQDLLSQYREFLIWKRDEFKPQYDPWKRKYSGFLRRPTLPWTLQEQNFLLEDRALDQSIKHVADYEWLFDEQENAYIKRSVWGKEQALLHAKNEGKIARKNKYIIRGATLLAVVFLIAFLFSKKQYQYAERDLQVNNAIKYFLRGKSLLEAKDPLGAQTYLAHAIDRMSKANTIDSSSAYADLDKEIRVNFLRAKMLGARLIYAGSGYSNVATSKLPHSPLKNGDELAQRGLFTTIACSKNGLLALGCLDGTIRFCPQSSWTRGKLDLTAPEDQTPAPSGESPKTNGIWTLAFSPDGKWLASGKGDGTLSIWDVQNSANVKLAALCIRQNAIKNEKDDEDSRSTLSVTFSPDSQWLACSFRNGTVQIWRTSSFLSQGGQTRQIPHPNGILHFAKTNRLWNIAFPQATDGDGKQNGGNKLATFFHREVRIWDIEKVVKASHPIKTLASKPKEVKALEKDGLLATYEDPHLAGTTYYCMSFDADGKRLAVGDYDHFIHFLRFDPVKHTLTQETVTRAHSGPVAGVAWNPKQESYASVGKDDSMVYLWNAGTSESRLSLQLFNSPTANPTDEKVRLLSEDLKVAQSTFYCCTSYVCFSQDGNYVLAGNLTTPLHIWNTSQSRWLPGQPGGVKICDAHEGPAWGLEFKDDQHLISAGSDAKIHFWRLSPESLTSPALAPIELQTTRDTGHGIKEITLSSKPEGVISGDVDTGVHFWGVEETADRNLLTSKLSNNQNKMIVDVAVSPDGTVAFSPREEAPRFLSLTSQKPLPSPVANLQPKSQTVAFSHDGRWFAYAANSSEGTGTTVHLFDLTRNKEINVPSIKFSNDVYRIRFIQDHTHKGGTKLLCFSDDGTGKFISLSSSQPAQIAAQKFVTGNSIFAADAGTNSLYPWVICADITNTLYFYEYSKENQDKILPQFMTLDHLGETLYKVKFNPTGDAYAFAGSNGSIHVVSCNLAPYILKATSADLEKSALSDTSLSISNSDELQEHPTP